MVWIIAGILPSADAPVTQRNSHMTTRAKQAGAKAGKKTVPKNDRAWSERKVTELKAEAQKLPADGARATEELDSGTEQPRTMQPRSV